MMALTQPKKIQSHLGRAFVMCLSLAVSACSQPDAVTKVSFTPSPALMAGDPEGAVLAMVDRGSEASGRTFRARLLANGSEANWITFHELSNDATQSLGDVLQPYMSEIDEGHGADVVIPFGRESQITGVILQERDTGRAWAGSIGVARSWGDGFRAGVRVGLLQEDESFLGLSGGGSLQIPNGRTKFSQIWAERRVGKSSAIFVAWTTGKTGGAKIKGDFEGDLSDTSSEAGVIGFRTYGVRRDGDSLSIALSTPLRVSSGRIRLSTPGQIDDDGNIRFVEGEGGLVPDGREIRLQVAYETPLSPTSSVGVKVWAQKNPGHNAQSDTDYGIGIDYRTRFSTGEWRRQWEERKAAREAAEKIKQK